MTRKMAFYIITYYFPTGMFVIVSWISFLVPPESVPGRMTILVTVFLCLVNIFNSITNKIPKADGLTAIEAFIIICIIFVFGALMGMNRISISILHQPKVECTHSTVTAPRLKLHVFRIRHNSVSTESSHSKAYQVPIQEQAEHSERDRDFVQKIRRQRLGSAH